MRVQYLNMYKWEQLNDGTKEKFEGRLDSLIFELSLQTKLGCADITIPVYLPEKMYNAEMDNKYRIAQKNYHLRVKKLSVLIDLIKSKVLFDKVIDGEFLYELWISKIFELNWKEDEGLNDPVKDLEVLYNYLLINHDVNPYEIDLNKSYDNENILKKFFRKFKK